MTDRLKNEVSALDGVISLQLQRGSSIKPVGDRLSVMVSNKHLPELMRLLDRFALEKAADLSINSSEPDSVVASGSTYQIDRDSNEATWEEMEMIISNDSNATTSTLLLMGIAGSLSVVGIVTNALHIVIGGMLIAPGFMPIIRIPLGLVSRHRRWYRGAIDTLKCYAALIAGAAATSLVLRAMDLNVMDGSPSYYQTSQPLLEYWTTITGPGLLASGVASLAGAILIATKRSIFTSGVMMGLALVPSAAIIGMAFTTAEWAVAGRASQRFGLDVILVLLLPMLYFLWERIRIHRRDMRL